MINPGYFMPEYWTTDYWVDDYWVSFGSAEPEPEPEPPTIRRRFTTIIQGPFTIQEEIAEEELEKWGKTK